MTITKALHWQNRSMSLYTGDTSIEKAGPDVDPTAAWASGCGCRVVDSSYIKPAECQLGVMIFDDTPPMDNLPDYNVGHIIQTKSGPLHIVVTKKYFGGNDEDIAKLTQRECIDSYYCDEEEDE